MRLYVVCGTTGEYSDRSEWLTRAFDRKSLAENHIRTLQDTYRSFSSNYGHYRSGLEYDDLLSKMEVLDPSFEEDYTGTSWFIQEVDFESSHK